MNPLITIVGPTAVGKTDLTLELAEQLHAEVISGDAYQVYKQLNIGTAKPSVDELNRVKHHLIDILEPNDSYSVSIFQNQAKEIIARLKDRNILPILSGGTGLYYWRTTTLMMLNLTNICEQNSMRSIVQKVLKAYETMLSH